MDWIKKNYAQFILAILALLLLAMSALLITYARGFEDTFAGIRGEVRKNNTIPPLDLAELQQAQGRLAQPVSWSPKQGAGSVFVSDKYVIQDGVPVNPLKGDKMLHPPVPNRWFIENGLEILATNILQEDADQDGFTNLEEWTGTKPEAPGTASTDPQNKNSHPPFVNKLRLVRFISQPFRLLFNAYDGDPARPEEMTFQINTLDVTQPTQFLKLGQQIEGTKFKIMSFAPKKTTDLTTGTDQDISELTVQNMETGESVVLTLEKVANSPDSFGLFKFLLDGSEFRVKKDKVFALKPEPERQYKLIDIEEGQALIQDLKTGEKLKVNRQ
jgi:hypothetical protein